MDSKLENPIHWSLGVETLFPDQQETTKDIDDTNITSVYTGLP